MIPELSPSEFKEVAAFFQNMAVKQGYELLMKKGPKGFTKNFDVIKLVNSTKINFQYGASAISVNGATTLAADTYYVFTFTRSQINDKYVYIQKNKGQKKAVKEYEARFTYQRLFDEGYLLAAVA